MARRHVFHTAASGSHQVKLKTAVVTELMKVISKKSLAPFSSVCQDAHNQEAHRYFASATTDDTERLRGLVELENVLGV